MKRFPKTIYVTATVNEDDDIKEFYVSKDKVEIADEEECDTEVAVYQLVKTGRVVKSSKIVFDD